MLSASGLIIIWDGNVEKLDQRSYDRRRTIEVRPFQIERFEGRYAQWSKREPAYIFKFKP